MAFPPRTAAAACFTRRSCWGQPCHLTAATSGRLATLCGPLMTPARRRVAGAPILARLRLKEYPMRAQPHRSQRSDTTVDDAVARHGRNPDATLPVLQDVQAANHGSLSKPVLGAAADALRVNDARVYGVGSFYGSPVFRCKTWE